jgi:hypothetical protein
MASRAFRAGFLALALVAAASAASPQERARQMLARMTLVLALLRRRVSDCVHTRLTAHGAPAGR